MSDDFQLLEINPDQPKDVPSAAQISSGIPIPPIRVIEIMEPNDWERFIEEWLSYHKNTGKYQLIRRLSGPGDLGLDVVAFTGQGRFAEPWDSFQCKHYDHPLEPKDILAEIGKIIYHSFHRTPPFNQYCFLPRRHIFVSPNGTGITVSRWLGDHEQLRNAVVSRWETDCAAKLGKGVSAPLEDELAEYVSDFDFSIFGDKTAAELIEEHAQTPFHASRFGGGLPPREEPPAPPAHPRDYESLYLRKLLEVYEERTGTPLSSADDLSQHPTLVKHYDRQRVYFYSAEALRNFARDWTPAGTFKALKEDIYNGVVDVCEGEYESGYRRLTETISRAALVDVSGNALVGVMRVSDKQGTCHHLANDDRLTWVIADE